MAASPFADVTVVIPFGDDEEVIGGLVRRLAAYLRAFHRRFEIVCADEDCGDNSRAILALLRTEIPEISILDSAPRRGFSDGARTARGQVLWFVEPRRPHLSLAPASRAIHRVGTGACDVAYVPGRYVVARRTRVWRVVDGARGRGDAFARRLCRRARSARLTVERLPGGRRVRRLSQRIALLLRPAAEPGSR